VLFSGGIDSSACIYFYKKNGFKVKGLFVNYGQKAIKQEASSVKALSKYFKIQVDIIEITTNLLIASNGIIQGRNNLLISIALMNFPYSNGVISLGVHSGTHFPDCSTEFIQQAQRIIDFYSDGNIVIDCPFINMTKLDIYKFCLKNELPLNLTYSCELGEKQPCGKCSTCKDLNAIYESKD